MRISDWSSDVCSSDLFARQNHGLRRLWAVDEDDALLRSRRGNIEILPALHVARHAPKTEALLEQRLQFRQARIADRKDLRIVGPNRSEEHTSELQSLMRISYAAFCLKKKTLCNNRKT